jgi:hypothetical protein
MNMEIHPKFIKLPERSDSVLKKGGLPSPLSGLFKQELRDRAERKNMAKHVTGDDRDLRKMTIKDIMRGELGALKSFSSKWHTSLEHTRVENLIEVRDGRTKQESP